MPTADSQSLPFAEARNSRLFFDALVQQLFGRIEAIRKPFVSSSNIQVFHHGVDWTFPQGNNDGYTTANGTLKKEAATLQISLDRILHQDLTLIEEFLQSTSVAIGEGMIHRMFEALTKVAELPENLISLPKKGPIGPAYLAAVASTPFSIDTEGNLSPPTFFVDPDVQERIRAFQTSANPEDKAKLAALLCFKESEAREREKSRLDKFNAN